eukprot:286778-Rhodomonas_salina.2
MALEVLAGASGAQIRWRAPRLEVRMITVLPAARARHQALRALTEVDHFAFAVCQPAVIEHLTRPATSGHSTGFGPLLARPQLRPVLTTYIINIHHRAVGRYLEEGVQDVRVCFLHLVKEHDRVRPSPHMLRQLSARLVADVAGRRPDEARHRVLHASAAQR